MVRVTMPTSLKKYLVGFIIGFSLMGSVSYAANNGSIGALFTEIAGNWKLMGDEIQDDTVDSSEIEDDTIVSADIKDDTIVSADIKDASIGGADLVEDYIVIGDDIVTNSISVDEIILNGVSFTGITTVTAPATCIEYIWSPSPAEFCSTASFTQLSNCGIEKYNVSGVAPCNTPDNMVSGVEKKFLTSHSYLYGGVNHTSWIGCVDVDIVCNDGSCNISWNKIGQTGTMNVLPASFVYVSNDIGSIIKGETIESPIHTINSYGKDWIYSCTVKWDNVDNNIKVYGLNRYDATYRTYQKSGFVVEGIGWYTLD